MAARAWASSGMCTEFSSQPTAPSFFPVSAIGLLQPFDQVVDGGRPDGPQSISGGDAHGLGIRVEEVGQRRHGCGGIQIAA